MNKSFLFQELENSGLFRNVRNALKDKPACLHLYNLSGAQKVHFAAALVRETGRPLLVLTESEKSAAKAQDDYAALLDGAVSLFPAREMTFYQ